jgi:acyl transferase domain-containing protein/NAD(P)-dependent dehydrogenase (short-subunit alcohol dehydrogenase family)/acyl carrier protein
MEITKDKIDRILNKVYEGEMSPIEATNEFLEEDSPKTLLFHADWERQELTISDFEEDRGYILYLGVNELFFNNISSINRDKCVIGLQPSTKSTKDTKNVFLCNFEDKYNVQKTMSEVINEYGLPTQIVVTPWLIDSEISISENALQTLMYLTQEIMAYKPTESVNLMFVFETQDSVHYGALDGFFKTLRLENDLFRYSCIEIDGHIENFTNDILNELMSNNSTTYVRYHNGNREIRHLIPISGIEEPEISKKDVILITGGTGKIAEMLAMYLSEIYDCRVVLLGRRQINDELQDILEQPWAKQNVEYISCGVNSFEELRKVMENVVSKYGDISGIIHCAGVIEDEFIIKKEWSDVLRVIEPKILGTQNLYKVATEFDVKYMILFSSIVAVFGNVGQMDYAYANAFMDLFAETKKGESGVKVYSVNWPFWEQGGMKIDNDKLAVLEDKTGLIPMPTNIGLDVFGKISGMPSGQIVVLYGNQKKLSNIVQEGLIRKTTSSNFPKMIENSNNAIKYDLIDNVIEYIKYLIFKFTKIPVEKISNDTKFESLGLDSVIIMQINEQLEKDFGCLSKALFYEYSSCGELAQYLFDAYYAQIDLKFGDGNKNLENSTENLKASNRISRVSDRTIRKKARSASDRKNKEIAIVGIAGKYPGASDIDELWINLCAGKDCISEVPKERWDWKKYYDPIPENAKYGKSYAKNGGFLEGADEFDPYFFNISPIEAEMMDPQERLFIEIVWEAMEDAGVTKPDCSKISSEKELADTGVFVGVTSNTYSLWGPEEWTRNNPVTPNAFPWTIANRVSFLFDFHGPSIAYDTACSSSLIAIHEACESIKRGECRQAIAGGVNLYLHPYKFVSMCKMRMLSVSGTCSSFGKNADGFVAGEGCGAIILKSLDDAIRDKDYIYGVIKGSAVNHGGRTNGYTVPSPRAQAEVITKAIENSNISARDISYIEAHGTGTILGDPIEVEGMSKAFSKYTEDSQFCAIGSVKANIGHGESAAGVAGVTKILLQMQHGELVPSIHSEEINANINFENSPFYVQNKVEKWNRPALTSQKGYTEEKRRVAGISSFGAGGTNAHIIIEEYERRVEKNNNYKENYVVLLSAQTNEILLDYAQKLNDYLKLGNNRRGGDFVSIKNIAYTLSTRRKYFEKRVAFIVDSENLLSQYIQDFIYEKNQKVYCSDGFEINDSDKYELVECWIKGENINFEDIFFNGTGTTIPCPTYPFLKERFWFEKTKEEQKQINSLHPLVDRNVSTLEEQCYEKRFSCSEDVLKDHVIKGRCIVPATAYLEMAFACAQYASSMDEVIALENIRFLMPLSVDNSGINVKLRMEVDDAITYKIESEFEDNRRLHSVGEIIYAEGANNEKIYVPIKDLIDQCVTQKTGVECYKAFMNAGFEYGKYYQTVNNVKIGMDYAIVELQVNDESGMKDMYMHPGIIDGALQTAGVLLAMDTDNNQSGGYVPYSLKRIEVYGKLNSKIYAYIKHKEKEDRGIECFDIWIVDSIGCVKVYIRDYLAHEVERHAIESNKNREDVLKLLADRKINAKEALKLISEL